MAVHNGINDGLTVMRTALKVLVATSYGSIARSEDLEILCRYAPDLAGDALDDFARGVIQRISLARADLRQE